MERFVVRYVQSDPQPDCFCVLENSNLKDLILALDRVLADGLIKIEKKTNNDDDDVLLIGGYYSFLNGRETTTPSDDDELGRIQRWICRAIETGTLADRIREAVLDVTFFYEKNALIALERSQNRILSALEMLNAVIVPVFWTSDSNAARRHKALQRQKREAEARKQKKRQRKSSDSSTPRRKASSAMGGLTGVFQSTGLGSLIGVDSPSRVPRFRSEDTRAKFLDHDYPLTASITGVHQIGSHWQYEVTVRCVQTGERWTVSRRFSYFVNLYVVRCSSAKREIFFNIPQIQRVSLTSIVEYYEILNTGTYSVCPSALRAPPTSRQRATHHVLGTHNLGGSPFVIVKME